MRTLSTTVFLALFSLAACAKDPSADAPAAKVSAPEAAPVPANSPAAADPPAVVGAQELALTGHIGFIGSKVTGAHEGEFKDFTGKIVLVDGKPQGGKLEFSVKTASVAIIDATVGKEKLENHLKSTDFFDAEHFPEARFVSKEISQGAGGKYTVKGTLTLKGISRDLEFPSTIETSGGDIRGRSEFTINRKDFGLVYAGKADDLIRDGVVLKIDLKGKIPGTAAAL